MGTKEFRTLTIRTKEREFVIPERKPVIIKWKATNKQRQGISTGIGWLLRGEKPHTFQLVHSAFQTWDKVEQEYPCTWTIWESQIIDVHQVQAVR